MTGDVDLLKTICMEHGFLFFGFFLNYQKINLRLENTFDFGFRLFVCSFLWLFVSFILFVRSFVCLCVFVCYLLFIVPLFE